MGECLIARGQTATKNVLDDIPVSGDYCSIVVLLQDSAGGPCENTKINCKDGTRWYNYTTNEAGMALFKCNSGSANFNVNKYIDGSDYLDQAHPGVINVDAPVGTKILKKINYITQTGIISRATAGWYNVRFKVINRIKNVSIIGGGGGGSGGGTDKIFYKSRSSTDTNHFNINFFSGGGGGGGAKNFSQYIDIVKDQWYNIYIGGGGKGSSYFEDGNSGGSSSGFGMIANGGSGGNWQKGGSGGVGLFKGGDGGDGSKMFFNVSTDNPSLEATNNECYWYGNAYPGNNGINGAGGGGGSGFVQKEMWSTGFKHYHIGNSFNGGGWGYQEHEYNANYRTLRQQMTDINGNRYWYNVSIDATGGTGGGGGGAGVTVDQYQSYYNNKTSLAPNGGNGACGRIEFEMV